MRVKPRTLPIIAFSSLIIASVLGLTIFGSYTYLEWKEKSIRRNHKLALYELDGKLFGKYIMVNLQPKIATEGIFKDKPIVSGSIKNRSDKKIYSLKLKIAFFRPDRKVVYVDRFHPIGLEFESLVNIGDITKKTENFLEAGGSISFEHQLKNCPPEISDFLKSESKAEPLKLEYRIEGLDIR